MSKYKLTIYEDGCGITYETDNASELIKRLESAKEEETAQEKETPKTHARPLTPFERCRNAVYASGNRWAIENFNATH